MKVDMVQSNQLTETEIIQRIKRGEKALYEIIVRRFNPHLYRVARSYGYNHQDAQDLMQETFIDAYKSLSQFANRAHFKTWMIRIMMNNCYRKKEKSSFKNEVMQEIPDHSTPLFARADNDTDRIVRNHELGRMIETALVNIPLDYRMVFSLREINGLNVAETAEVLQISKVNVKVRLTRAKAMLRREIERTYTPSELFEFNLIHCDAMVEKVMEQTERLA